jgi:hypothetical protein
VFQGSREKAESEYKELIDPETVETTGDTPGGRWRKDPTQFTDTELKRETEKLQFQLNGRQSRKRWFNMESTILLRLSKKICLSPV